MTASDEVRIIDPTTGGEKGQKLDRFDLLPARSLRAIARHFGIGAKKYEDRNWERGYAWSLSYGALQRHLNAWWGGEDLDEETGSSHLAAAGFHVLALLEFLETHPELDDRPTSSDRQKFLSLFAEHCSGALQDFYDQEPVPEVPEPSKARVSVRKITKSLAGICIALSPLGSRTPIAVRIFDHEVVVAILDALEDAGYEVVYQKR